MKLFIIALLVVFTFYFPFVTLAVAGVFSALALISWGFGALKRSHQPLWDLFFLALIPSSLTIVSYFSQ